MQIPPSFSNQAPLAAFLVWSSHSYSIPVFCPIGDGGHTQHNPNNSSVHDGSFEEETGQDESSLARETRGDPDGGPALESGPNLDSAPGEGDWQPPGTDRDAQGLDARDAPGPGAGSRGKIEGSSSSSSNSSKEDTQASGSDGSSGSTSGTPVGSSGSPSAWAALVQRIRDLRQLCSSALVQCIGVLDRWYIRLAAVLGFVLALISAVINMVLVPIVNYQMMPGWQHAASQATQRQVGAPHAHVDAHLHATMWRQGGRQSSRT